MTESENASVRARRLALQGATLAAMTLLPHRLRAQVDPAPAARILRVGHGAGALSVAEAARIARDGDRIEIFAGDYSGAVASWPQSRLEIRAVGGPVRIHAAGRHAEGKAIWVIRNGVFDIEGIAFHGARVPARNGAGIRFERGHLRLHRCSFFDNEMGLLTANDASAHLALDGCVFARNGVPPAPDGTGARGPIGHGLYVGRIASLHVRACHLSQGRVGHLLKTRARSSRILYSRLSDDAGGSASYELEFAEGGDALVMGCLIVQEEGTRNATLLSYGAEGLRWPRNALVLAHNTLVNRREAGGTFVRIHERTRPSDSEAASAQARAVDVQLCNNLFVGAGQLQGAGLETPLQAASGNLRARPGEFIAAEADDYTPAPTASFLGRAVHTGACGDPARVPTQQYRHPAGLTEVAASRPWSPGAFQR